MSNRPTITFTNTHTAKAKKTWHCVVTEDLQLSNCSPALQAMIMASLNLWEDFTLEELATEAVTNCGLETKSTDMHALGYTHRPKLIEMGIISDKKPEAPAEDEAEDLVPEQDCSDVSKGLY